jgi:hypothetical protein
MKYRFPDSIPGDAHSAKLAGDSRICSFSTTWGDSNAHPEWGVTVFALLKEGLDE